MGTEIALPANFGKAPAVFANSVADNDELSSGIVTGFSVVGFRGKVWRVKCRGETIDVLANQADPNSDPKASLEVVLVKAADHVSKIFYVKGYVEGSTEPPDCWSSNGVVPDASVAAPVCKSCAVCPKNQFGSRITESGKKGKACSDHKRVAIVPLDDVRNEMFGGAMLLRVPAASLKELVNYSQMLKKANYGYYSVATRISFDRDAAFPRLLFNPVRPLSDDEAALIAEMRDDHQVSRVLNEEQVGDGNETETPDNVVPFEQPQAPKAAPVVAKAAPAVAPKPAPVATAAAALGKLPQSAISAAMANPRPLKTAAAAPVQAAPAPEPEQGEMENATSSLDDELDALLAQ